MLGLNISYLMICISFPCMYIISFHFCFSLCGAKCAASKEQPATQHCTAGHGSMLLWPREGGANTEGISLQTSIPEFEVNTLTSCFKIFHDICSFQLSTYLQLCFRNAWQPREVSSSLRASEERYQARTCQESEQDPRIRT